MTYKLTLTDEDIRTLHFVGGRYCWSDALLDIVDVGENTISEPDAWTLSEAFEADCEGGHSPFPMLDKRSELAEKLYEFWDDIV